MEPHATAEELLDQGLTLPPPNNSCASVALTDQQPAADDDSCSSGTSSGSATGSSDRPYTVPAASSSSSNQALIWAPTGFKQQTYRPVQFRPHATGDGQSRATSGGDSSSRASVTSAPEAPPWRVSGGAPEAFEASTGEKASRLSSRPTSDSVSLLLEKATAPLPSRAAAMDEAGRQFPDAEELRPPTSASCVEQVPCSGEGLQASCSSPAAPATASAAHQRSAVYPVEQQQQYEHQAAADHQSCNGGSGNSGGGSSPRPLQQSQLQSPHEAAEAAEPPTIAPKPSRGARLFAERQHRAAASAEAGSSLPEESATSQPPPLESRRLTDDDDASSVASDTSSVGSSKLPPPAVPPKPRLRQPLSETSSENEGRVDANNGTGLLLQTRFSADESTAAALPANQTKEAAADSGGFTAMPPPPQEQPPVPRMRPRNPPPPAAQPAGAAEVVRRKSLYEIVSTEGRREDKGLTRELQPQQKQLAAAAEERNSTSSHSGSCRQPGQSSHSHKPRPASDSQAPASVLHHQRPVWWAATLPSRCTGDVLPASRDSAGLLAPTMTCSACGSSDASQAAAAASSTAVETGQNGQQTTDELTVAPSKGYDFPLRLPPTRSSFVTLLQRQRLENRSEAMFSSADPGTLSDDGGIRPTELCRSTAAALDYSKCQQPSCAGAGAKAGRDDGSAAEGNQAPVQPALFADLCGCAGGSSSREPEAALPAAAAAGSSSWTTESLDGSSRKQSGATTGGSIVPAHSRYRPAAGCMQTLLGSPNSERGRSLGEADRSGGADRRPTNSSDGSSCSGNPASVASPTSHRDWYKKMFKQLHSVDKQGEASFRILEAIKVYEEKGSLNDTDINDNQISSMTYQMHEDPPERTDEEEKYLGIERSSSLGGTGSVASHSAYIRLQRGGEVPFTGFRKQLPQVEKSVSTQSAAATAKLEPQAAAPPEAGYYREQVLPDRKQREEQQTRRRQIMEQVEAAEKRRKAEKERLDQESRRHSDFFIPSAKVSITENRFDDFLASLPAKPPRAKAVTAQPGLRVRALFSFTAENSRELSFQKDDVICLLGQLDKHWLAGELNGNVGIFPCSYVVEVSQSVGAESAERSRDREGSARAKYNFKSEGGNELALRKGDFVTLIRRIDTNWYEVRSSSSNRQGIVPVSYLDVHNESASTGAKGSTPTSIKNRSAKTGNGSQGFTKTSVPLLCEAMYDYQKQYPDELDLRQGDVVRVVESCDDGWLFGTLMRTGTFGTLPGNYVKPVEPSQAMRLLQDGS